MSDIPTEIYIEILCQLPVEPLLRFRCVCKSWKAIIDSQTFGKMHLKISETNPKLMLCGLSCWSWSRIHALSNCTMPTLSYPYPVKNISTIVMGYCDGLLLIACGIDCAVWNPSTCMYTVLPYLEDKKPKGFDLFHHYGGIGYDKITDDYKVLRILAGDNIFCTQTVVYSLKSRCYGKVKDFPVMFFLDWFGYFVFGALHWLVLYPSETDDGPGQYMIAAFDLGNEEYNYVDFPLHLPLHFSLFDRLNLGVFEGCLSLSCNYEGKHVDIWLLKDPKKRRSWVKLFSLKVDVNWSLKENVKPISYSKCGNYAIFEKDEEELLYYDLKLKSMRKIPLDHGMPRFNTFLFSESLVLNDQAAEERDREIKKNKTKKRDDDILSSGFKLKL